MGENFQVMEELRMVKNNSTSVKLRLKSLILSFNLVD